MVAKKWTVEILDVAPARERGLKFRHKKCNGVKNIVAPVRERGLKYQMNQI